MKRYCSVGILLLLCSSAIAIAEPILQPSRAMPYVDSVFVTRPFENPLTLEEIEQMNTSAITNFNRNFRSPNHPIVFCIPGISDSTYVVAYGFKVFADGTVKQYAGIVGDSQSVPLVHQEARKWKMDTEMDTANIQPLCCTWQLINSYAENVHYRPYGAINNGYELYWLSGDSSPTTDCYAIKQTCSTRPGRYKYGSDWDNYTSNLRHSWIAHDPFYGQFGDYDPQGTSIGPLTIDVSLLCDCDQPLCWTFPLADGVTMDEASQRNHIAEWRIEYTTIASQRGPMDNMQPGSTVLVNTPSIPGTYRLVNVMFTAVFKNKLGETHDIDSFLAVELTIL